MTRSEQDFLEENSLRRQLPENDANGGTNLNTCTTAAFRGVQRVGQATLKVLGASFMLRIELQLRHANNEDSALQLRGCDESSASFKTHMQGTIPGH